MEIKREHHINFWYIILAFLAVMLIQDFMVAGDADQNHPLQRVPATRRSGQGFPTSSSVQPPSPAR